MVNTAKGEETKRSRGEVGTRRGCSYQATREARGPPDEFKGSLSTMRKNDPKEIATALGLLPMASSLLSGVYKNNEILIFTNVRARPT